MRGLMDKIKKIVVYDADTEFYAKVFPDSVTKKDLVRIRTMTHADLPYVLTIEHENYEFPWEKDIFIDCFNAGYYCWVCDYEDQVLGYCLMSMAVGEAHLLNISVAAKEQKQGLARKMLEHIIATAQGKAETLFLEVRPSNVGAIALYEDMGFNEIGIRKGYYPAKYGREDAIMLALELL
ncbi:MAG: ribosomal protein S18-alanine N-acetyltransferase [Methylococcales bacterium]|nr:ribosomal protein S18-alanine N-acetyltransferase [Methylococcales bacterium]